MQGAELPAEAENYARWYDDIEPIEDHPIKISVIRGNIGWAWDEESSLKITT